MADTFASITDQLAHDAAASVAALPGVARLEPTLTNALRRIRNVTAGRITTCNETTYLVTDGIRVTRYGHVVNIHVDITVTTQPANLTAAAVRESLFDTITAHQLNPGEVTVTVLRIKS